VRIVPGLLDLEFAAAAGVALGGNLFQEVLDADLTAATSMLDDAAPASAKIIWGLRGIEWVIFGADRTTKPGFT
jgi:hypothetical protein